MNDMSYYPVIEQGMKNANPKLPLFHGGYWFDTAVSIDVRLNSSWLYKYPENIKANTDIQKLIGYSLDPFRCDIIRIGFSNGFARDSRVSKYDGKHLYLHAYLTKNFKRLTLDGYGKMTIGKIDPTLPFRIYHQLTEEGYPYFEVHQVNMPLSFETIPVSFTPSILNTGYNMNPYWEADYMGAPTTLRATISLSRVARNPNLKHHVTF